MQIIKGQSGFWASVEKSFDEIDEKWRDYPGLIITGSHAPEEFDLPNVLEEIRLARVNQLPTLGICFGMQLMVIEAARNVFNLPGANSTEINMDTPQPIVTKLPGFRTGIGKVGNRMESHWHQYAVNNDFLANLSTYFKVLLSPDKVVEMIWLEPHNDLFYLGVQYHPEYQSSKEDPHPVLLEFIKRCKKNYGK